MRVILTVFLAKQPRILCNAPGLLAAEKIKDRFGPYDHLVLVICGGNESVSNLVNYAKMT